MDYRDLLQRYMAHVWYEAGTPFIVGPCPDCFTLEEWRELQSLGQHANTACAGRLEQDLAEDYVSSPDLILHRSQEARPRNPAT